jgi:stage V sporulation protein S
MLRTVLNFLLHLAKKKQKEKVSFLPALVRIFQCANSSSQLEAGIRVQLAHSNRQTLQFHVLSRRHTNMAELIKVSAQSRSTAVAGAIAGVMRDEGFAEMQAIGASAVNQAIKAIAIARGYLQEDGIDLMTVPSFTEVDIEGNERTAVRMAIYKRAATAA